MKVLLICFSGMSTGIMSIRMKQAAKAQGIDLDVKAVPLTELEANLSSVEAVLVGPQLKFVMPEIEDRVQGKVPVMYINSVDYGVMNGEKVLKDLLESGAF